MASEIKWTSALLMSANKSVKLFTLMTSQNWMRMILSWNLSLSLSIVMCVFYFQRCMLPFCCNILINKTIGYFTFKKSPKQWKVSWCFEAEIWRRCLPPLPHQSHHHALEFACELPSPKNLELQNVVNCLCSDWALDLWTFDFTDLEWVIMDQLEDILEVSKCHMRPAPWSSFTK